MNVFFNPKDEHPLEMFSWQHWVALIIVLAIYLAVFFARKFFMKYRLADQIFRCFLGFLIIVFEAWLYWLDEPTTLFAKVFGQVYALCGQLVWITGTFTIADSARLMKLIYPLTMLGAMLSMIVLDMGCTFPHFKAIQFFVIHAGFMLCSLYFVFTRKINKYTLKDLGNSLLTLFVISIYALLLALGRLHEDPTYSDPLYIISPPGDLMFIKNAVGQFWYTVLYIVMVIAIQFGVYGITYLCTKHREDDYKPELMPEDIVIRYVSKIPTNTRTLLLFIYFGVQIYLAVLYYIMNSKALMWIDIILFFVFMILFILNEHTNIYLMQDNNNEEKKDEEDSIEVDMEI